MDTRNLHQLASAHADFGTLHLGDGRAVHFIELHHCYLRAGTHHTAPPLQMTPDQARSLAMLLLTAADKAPGGGIPTSPVN